jgi:hypothetical protein
MIASKTRSQTLPYPSNISKKINGTTALMNSQKERPYHKKICFYYGISIKALQTHSVLINAQHPNAAAHQVLGAKLAQHLDPMSA